MCTGESARASQGGAIAVLHPTADRGSFPGLDSDLLILLRQSQATPRTCVTLRQRRNKECTRFDGCYIIIHQDGNLNASSPPQRQTMYEFRMPACPSPRGPPTLELMHRLNLGLGADGVIGRRVTVHQNGPADRAVAEGIIGWN